MTASDETRFEAAQIPSKDGGPLVSNWLTTPRQALDELESQLLAWVAEQAEAERLNGAHAPIEADSSASGQVVELLAENQRLAEENAELQTRVSGSAATREQHELQQLYDMACAEIRELKFELENRPEVIEAVVEEEEQLDWESAKKRMLAELEAEDGLSAKDQSAVDRILARTDETVAQLKAEVERLQLCLEATGADKTIETLLDSDALISQERERLATFQREWENKLRKAEIEISIERAKLAREKAEQDEQIRQLEEQLNAHPGSGDDGKPNRGRWLARLGLSDE
jgi:hypothetical protein